MRTLSDVKRDRDSKEDEKKERKMYKESTGDIPVRLWTAKDMLDYFNVCRKRHGVKINKAIDQRTIFTQLASIKRLALSGPLFVDFLDWAERNNEVFPVDIYHLVNQIKKFKKIRKDLFNGKEK